MSYDVVRNRDARELFRNGHTIDILYAWTPREKVRRLSEEIAWRTRCKLMIHFEDNEEYLSEVATGKKLVELLSMSEKSLDAVIAGDRYHPIKGKAFIEKAHGLSYLIDSLKRFDAFCRPHAILSAPVDETLFFERPVNLAYRRELGISDEECVITYAGNVHDANVAEVLELYLAVQLLNTRGLSTTLLRTGNNACLAEEKLSGFEKVINLGWVDRERMPSLQACANIFIQPGSPGQFNDERVPSKLPEFFAIGRPVLLPRSNIGLRVRDAEDGLILDDVSAEGIASKVELLAMTPGLASRLSHGARAFYVKHLKADASPMIGLIGDVLRLKQTALLSDGLFVQ
jgi:hypothetical protein